MNDLWFIHKDAKHRYLSNNYLVLDFEATTHPNGALNPDNDLVLACWTIFKDGAVIKKSLFSDEYGMQELLDDIGTVDFVVAQHAKYELQWLSRCGLELRDVLVWDTLLAEWVLDGNVKKPRDLDSLAKRYGVPRKLDLIKKLWKAGVPTELIPRRWLKEYCARDVETTAAIFEKQRELIYGRQQEHLVLVRNLTCACLAAIEFHGMHLDPERVEKEYERVNSILGDSEQSLAEISGGINFGSAKQRGEFLFETMGFSVPTDHRGKPLRTAGGAYPTDAATIHRLDPSNDAQRRFLSTYREYNKARTLLTKNLDFFRGVCREYGGWFRSVFNQNVTSTHRLSSSGLALQFSGQKKAKGVDYSAYTVRTV